MAPLAPLLLALLGASALAGVSRADTPSSFVACPTASAVSVSISVANVSAFFADGSLTYDDADSPEACVSLAQQNGCSGEVNRFYVYSKAGFSPDKGPKLGNCLYGSACAAKGLPSGTTAAVIGSITPIDCSYNFLPCPYGVGIRSVGLNLSYSPDGSIFYQGFFPSYANVSSVSACRVFAELQNCNSFPFKKGAAGSGHRSQEVAQAPASGGGFGSFFVYLPKGSFSYFGFDTTIQSPGNCLVGSACGELPPGNTPAFFGNVDATAMCPPSPPYPPSPAPPPPLKLAECPAGTGTAYIDTTNAYASFRRGAPYNYAMVNSAQECLQAALNDTCAGNPVDMYMYSLAPLSSFSNPANCAWGVCQGLAKGATPVKVGRVSLAQCPALPVPPPPPPPPRACLRSARNKRQCYCPVANASCRKNPLCGDRWVCTCKSGTPVLDEMTARLKSCTA